jgi:membrane associated rhomboid family serine protease
MTTTSVGMRCPECSRERTRVRQLPAMGGGTPTLTYILIGINVAVALGSYLSGGSGGVSGIGTDTIVRDGALSRGTVADGEVYRIVTSGFIHAGLSHLLFNMLGLWVLGSLLEPVVGRLRFGLIYATSLLAGSLGALIAQPIGFTVGASGAIFGLLGAAIVVLRARGVNPMESGLVFWLGLNLALTFGISGISIGGHIGGLIAGGIVGYLLFEIADRRRSSVMPVLAACVVLGAALAVACIAVAGSSTGV